MTAALARQAWLARVYAADSGVAEDEERFRDRMYTRSWVVDERVCSGVSFLAICRYRSDSLI